MLQRLVEQCRAVQIVTQESNMGRDPTIIYPNEWRLASDMLTVLSPFEEVTRALSKHSASISEVIPLLLGLCSIIKSLHVGGLAAGEDVRMNLISSWLVMIIRIPQWGWAKMLRLSPEKS